jgi:hypothetical protein
MSSENERPHHGGSYRRKADGSLELVERTAPPDAGEQAPPPEAAPAAEGKRTTKGK